MRYSRQTKILEIIKTQEIDTQNKLVEKLREAGYKATQATVSRDINELQLIKAVNSNGKSCYAQAPVVQTPTEERFRKILRETILNVSAAGNIVVVKTLSGCANAAAEVIDNGDNDAIVGTIAGDNTIFMVIDDISHVEAVVARIQEAAK